MSDNLKGWMIFASLIVALGVVGHIETYPI